ncbi:MAG TPA: tRNA (5-methylaminomethyl-2-thiouridine)(34)-methyltransferase MnmD [Chitinophagaceae bacterium]|nr:tRNA (5-methylaminomethyl-2-thiouridine)(34)-methyltransferase MnmD [Chitinophagaceae bacterium]
MQRKLILTNDGSDSLAVPDMGVTYHSVHGALQESRHVFIASGLYASDRFRRSDTLHIFEMGFGTGLNALLILVESERVSQKIYYETVELFPLHLDEVKMLNYCNIMGRNDLEEIFARLHTCEWEKEIEITSNFVLKKIKVDLASFHPTRQFDLVFFDAFDPNAQPELWTEKIFKKMFVMLKPGGILTTYSSKGTVRRAMQSAGLTVDKIPGPPGKREIVRATKI